MQQSHLRRFAVVALLALLTLSTTGCTRFRDYVHNGFKVGPNYCPAQANVSEHWIDEADVRSESDPSILSCWWTVFNDRKLNELVHCAYRQNLSVKEAGFRILQSRAQLGIAVGEVFPQSQYADGYYSRYGSAVDPSSGFTSGRFLDQWDFGFGLNWELDFWGRFRRAVTAAQADLDASMDYYNAVIVTLLGDVAENYVEIRTNTERMRLAQYNIDNVQMKVWRRSMQRAGVDPETGVKREGGSVTTEADAHSAESTLQQTRANITQYEINRRKGENQLCVLLGIPVVDLRQMLGDGPIPTAPADSIVGIPADLLRRRPDVQRAERLAASQGEQIGIAESDLYPAFYINGSFGYQAKHFPDLFRSTAFNGSVGPSFHWDILNYGRIANNVRYNEAYFQELVTAYKRTVLVANREVEDGLVTFLQAQRRSRLLNEAVHAQSKAVEIARSRYLQGVGGEASFTTYTVYEQTLLSNQDLMAQAKGQIASGLIAVYRSLGGGWEIQENDEVEEAPEQPMPEAVEAPLPMSDNVAPQEPPLPKPEAEPKTDALPQPKSAAEPKMPDLPMPKTDAELQNEKAASHKPHGKAKGAKTTVVKQAKESKAKEDPNLPIAPGPESIEALKASVADNS